MPVIQQLYRYPIKGMTPQPLQMISVQTGQAIPFDRCIALAHSTTEFDPEDPKHQHKTKYVMLMKNEKLAELQVQFDENTGQIIIQQAGKILIEGNLDEAEQKQALEMFFADYLGDQVKGQPKLIYADDPDHTFSDVDARVISCINLASVQDVEATLQQPVHPMRFRANVYFNGAPAWSELDWVDKTFALGTAIVKVLKPITRCAATNVNPETAQRDLKIPNTLVKTYDHNYLGIYVQVVQDGCLTVGDEFTVL
ncbi:MOSC domain-containing protein [Candidatus Albibeggiatoa sp. nov. NOAA]|uniref:MOSC domain-containing protein n=1 Tax=Candidatus Albibeggiatoa sp. nov. NOAA TaxID=3162724 RepID=UPI0032F9F1AA|nr:MOSC domain-containing protein [Thiotrichaceae bacterium]